MTSLFAPRWLKEVANIFVDYKESWVHLVPRRRSGNFQNLDRFFDSVAALMSRQMRDMIVQTMEYFEAMFEKYQVN